MEIRFTLMIPSIELITINSMLMSSVKSMKMIISFEN